MNLPGSLFKKVCAACAMLLSVQVSAQNLPGTAVSDSAVSQSAITLISLAEQVYPSLFGQATPWRSYEGFFYKYFASSGVYVGINGADLYLMGGQFGNSPRYQGKIADAVIVLQSSPGAPSDPFKDVVAVKNTADLIRYFRRITVDYATLSTLGNVQSSVALEVLGQETLSGTATDRMRVTVSGTNVSTPLVYDMWVDSQGIIRKLLQGTFEYPYPMSNTIGAGLVSGVLLALAAADSPTVKAALNNQLANNAALKQATRNTTVSGIPVQQYTLTVSTTPSVSVELDLSDFGNFSMATRMRSVLLSTTTTFEMRDIQLR